MADDSKTPVEPPEAVICALAREATRNVNRLFEYLLAAGHVEPDFELRAEIWKMRRMIERLSAWIG